MAFINRIKLNFTEQNVWLNHYPTQWDVAVLSVLLSHLCYWLVSFGDDTKEGDWRITIINTRSYLMLNTWDIQRIPNHWLIMVTYTSEVSGWYLSFHWVAWTFKGVPHSPNWSCCNTSKSCSFILLLRYMFLFFQIIFITR